MTERIVAPERGPLTPTGAPGSLVHGQPWHALRPSEVVAHLRANLDAGLADDEARRRRARVGPNRVGEHQPVSLGRLALNQFRSLVVLLLLIASAIAWALGERAEAIA